MAGEGGDGRGDGLGGGEDDSGGRMDVLRSTLGSGEQSYRAQGGEVRGGRKGEIVRKSTQEPRRGEFLNDRSVNVV